MTTVTDDFNRANGGLGANWGYDTANSAWNIVSNRAVRAGGGNDTTNHVTGTGSADMYVQADVTGANSFYVAVQARCSGALGFNAYMGFLVPGASQAKIGKLSGGGYTDVATGTVTHGDAHTLRLEVNGSNQRLYVDGVLAVTGTDTTLTTGDHGGFNAGAGGGTIDNWSIGTYSPGVVNLVPANTSHAHTATTITLTGLPFSVDSAVHAHTADNLTFGATFLETFDDPDILLGRFSRSDFRTQWASAGGTGAQGQDTNQGHGTDLPDNVRISNGQMIVESGMQNYGETIVRSNTPWAGTGTIAFDVVGDGLSPECQVLVLVHDRPYSWTGFDGENAWGPKAQYGFGFYVAKHPGGFASPHFRKWSNYVETDVDSTFGEDIYFMGVLQHWVITLTGTTVSMTIDGNACSAVSTLPAGLNPVNSWISIGTHNHASIKYTPFVETTVNRYDNLTYLGLSGLAGRCAKVPLAGPNVFGWALILHGTGSPIVHETTDLALGTGATSAWLLFNCGFYDGPNDVTSTSHVYYQLNGNTEHQVPFQITNQNLGAAAFSIPVALSELVHGINTVKITGDNIGHITEARYANIELVVQGGSPSIAVRKAAIGGTVPSLAKLGTQTIGRMYLGTTELWAGPPPPPTGLTATPGTASVALAWTAPATATRYVAEFRLHKSLATQFGDTFDYRNETLTTPWVVRTGSTMTITGDVNTEGAGTVTTDTTASNSILTPGTLLTTDGFVQAEFQMAAGAALIGLSMRGTSTTATQNELAVELSTTGAWSLVEIIAGTRNVLASTGNVYVANSIVNVRLEAVGNQAAVYLNDVLTLTGTITTLLTGTRCSMRMNRTGVAKILSFAMGTFAIGGWRQFSTPTAVNTTVTALTGGQQYDFRVAAYNNYGRGDYTSIVSAVPT